jgi:hypothetical protein
MQSFLYRLKNENELKVVFQLRPILVKGAPNSEQAPKISMIHVYAKIKNQLET